MLIFIGNPQSEWRCLISPENLYVFWQSSTCRWLASQPFFGLGFFHKWATKCLPPRGFLPLAQIAGSHMMMRFGIEDEDAGVSWSDERTNNGHLRSFSFYWLNQMWNHWQGPYVSLQLFPCHSISFYFILFHADGFKVWIQLSCSMLVRREQWQEVSSLSVVWSVPWLGRSILCVLCRGEVVWKHTGCYKLMKLYKMLQNDTKWMNDRWWKKKGLL